MYDIVLARADDISWIDRKALELVIRYASGNPRDLILTLHNSIMHNLSESMLKSHHIIGEIKEVLGTYIDRLRISDSESKFLSLVVKKHLLMKRKAIIVKNLIPEMSRSTVYECFKTLSDKGMSENEDPFNINAKLALWYNYFVSQ